MATQNESIDLSGLRIDRPADAKEPSEKSRHTLILGIAAAILSVALGGYFLTAGPLSQDPEVQLTAASYSSPSQANAVLTASGYVVAQRKAAVASKGTGPLEYLGVVEGDKVKKGQIIARIENSDIRAQVDQAKANLKLNEALLKDSQRSLDRQKTLLGRGLTSQADYDAAEARYQQVLASIDVAKAQVTGAEVALENTYIRAPFDGTVLTKNADVGEMVAPMAASVSSRSAVVTLADMSSLEVEADVSESNIERISVNQPCEITLDAYPGTHYQGYVNKIVPTADRAKATVMVKVAFRSYDSKVLPEMSAKVLFLAKDATSASKARPVLTLPAAAVPLRDGRTVVYAVRGNAAVEIPVSAGKAMGGLIEITSGISAGEKVIARVDDSIRHGIKVVVK
jgi:RND family efflux transporter MFP subunit